MGDQASARCISSPRASAEEAVAPSTRALLEAWPATVRDYVRTLHAESGVNYVLGQMMFGTLSFEQASSSIKLFAREVMPAFAGRAAA